MDADAALAPLRSAFPSLAEFQGTHFKYAARDGGVLIETRKTFHLDDNHCRYCNRYIGEKGRRFFYWLLIDGHFKVVNASAYSRLATMQTIGQSLSQFFHP